MSELAQKVRRVLWLCVPFAVASCQCGDDPQGTGAAAGSGGEGPVNETTTTGTGGSGACAADTQTDPLNCGECGNACGVGTCFGGQCQTAEVLATGLATPGFIVVDGPTLYFATSGPKPLYIDGAIYSLPNDGSADPTVLVSSVPKAETVLLDGSDIVYLSAGTEAQDFADGYVARVPKSGGAPEVLESDQWWPQSIVKHADAFYLASSGRYSNDFVDGSLRQLGGSVLLDPEVAPGSLMVVGTDLWWLSYSPNLGGTNDGLLRRMPIAGGQVEDVATGLNRPEAAIQVGDLIYFTTDGFIHTIDHTAPGAPQVFVDNIGSIAAMAADGTDLYWTEPGGRVARKALAGGPVIVIAEGLSQPWGLALDDDYAYFVDRAEGLLDDGSVLRIHK